MGKKKSQGIYSPKLKHAMQRDLTGSTKRKTSEYFSTFDELRKGRHHLTH